jgi:hypothetical protein
VVYSLLNSERSEAQNRRGTPAFGVSLLFLDTLDTTDTSLRDSVVERAQKSLLTPKTSGLTPYTKKYKDQVESPGLFAVGKVVAVIDTLSLMPFAPIA